MTQAGDVNKVENSMFGWVPDSVVGSFNKFTSYFPGERREKLSFRASLLRGAEFGLASFCFYLLSLSCGNVYQVAQSWPHHVKKRITDSYIYLGGSITISALSAYAVCNSSEAFKLLTLSGWIPFAVLVLTLIASTSIVCLLPYQPGFGLKQFAWILYCAIVGATCVAPLCAVSGQAVGSAFWFTFCLSGRLTMIALSALTENFLRLVNVLRVVLMMVCAFTIAGYFYPSAEVFEVSVRTITLCSGLLALLVLLLFTTQRILKFAKGIPLGAERHFDPINSGLLIFLEILNIFIIHFVMSIAEHKATTA